MKLTMQALLFILTSPLILVGALAYIVWHALRFGFVCAQALIFE